MVKKTFLLRLLLDFVAAGLLLVALAYYWQGNAAHEWIGTGMFLLILLHNVFNRRWYGAVARTARRPRGLVDVVLALSLLGAMLALLTTSLMVSRTVFGFLQPQGGFTARQVHTFAAYWSVILVSVHLGIRWQRVMATARNALNLKGDNRLRTTALRLVCVAIAAHGVQASFAMGVGSKLLLRMSLDGWDFDASTPGFFLNWASISGLHVVASHYLWSLLGRQRGNPLTTAAPAKS